MRDRQDLFPEQYPKQQHNQLQIYRKGQAYPSIRVQLTRQFNIQHTSLSFTKRITRKF